MTRQFGTVYLVGAGPGDPGLITVRGRECIARADVIIYDALANPQLLVHARPGAECIFAGKERGRHTLIQEEINRLLVEWAGKADHVVRLKGGDPFVFGRGGEEAQLLARHGIPFEIVPGITAGIAAPAYAGIPVTHRGVAASATLLAGHSPGNEPGK
ncbi:MAG TPA: uroporphyrinogen-III C-methyltransferase, partial [Candidatus Hydrogenedentes bacterium]|nr:uroporphyrinogen-III C-methyltransferase [Candidatus Hydrogenedentota bacterium]